MYLVSGVVSAVLADQIHYGHLKELIKVGNLTENRLQVFNRQLGGAIAEHDKGIALAGHVRFLEVHTESFC